MAEIINKTYYNTEDIDALFSAVLLALGKSGGWKLTIGYLGKTTPYHEDTDRWSRGYKFTLESKGWGEVLSLGERPMATFNQRKGSTYRSLTLSLPRKNSLLGDEDLQKVGATSLKEVPEQVRKHLVFAICAHWEEQYYFSHTWESVKDLGIKLMPKADPEQKKKARINDLIREKATHETQLRNYAYWLRQARAEVERWSKEQVEHQRKLASVEAEIEQLKNDQS